MAERFEELKHEDSDKIDKADSANITKSTNYSMQASMEEEAKQPYLKRDITSDDEAELDALY